MPLKIPAGDTDKYFVVGKSAAGRLGIMLLAGQVANVVSADPLTVSIAPDSPSVPTDEALTEADGTAIPAGTPSLASGSVKGLASPAQPKVPINCTCTLTNQTDGSPVLNAEGVAIPPLVDTVEVDPDILESEGFLFGSIPAPAPQAKRK